MIPELSIAIPTYNRVENLHKALDRLFGLVDNRNVEIIVSDNASTDGTEIFMKEYQNEHKGISYFRNDQNLGYAGNFISCFNHANGKYVWLLSDDDILTDIAIDSVFDCIRKEPVIIKLKSRSKDIKDEEIKKEKIYEYTDKEQYYKHIGIMSTFISCMVFNNKIIKDIKKEKYMDDALIVGYVLESLKTEGTYIVNDTCCVLATPNERINYDLYKVWVYQYPHDMSIIGAESGFSKEFLMNQVRFDLDNTIFNFVTKFRKTCDTKKWNEEYVWKYVSKFPDLVPWYKVAIKSPKILLVFVRKIHKLYRKVKRIR